MPQHSQGDNDPTGPHRPRRNGGLIRAAAAVLAGGLALAGAPAAHAQDGDSADSPDDAAGPTAGIVLEHQPADPQPGERVTLDLWVVNDSDAPAVGYQVDSTLPAAFVEVSWTCEHYGAGSECGVQAGTGKVADTIDVGAGGGAVVYEVAATLDAQPAETSWSMGAALTPAPDGACEPCHAGVTVGDVPTVVLSKTYHPQDPAPAPGEEITYTITLTNDSTVAAAGHRIEGPLPPEVVDVTWVCAATGAGSACGVDTGVGGVRDVADVGAGGTVVYTVTGTVARGATEPFRQYVTLQPQPGQECAPVESRRVVEPVGEAVGNYSRPPAAELLTCLVNNVVSPSTSGAGDDELPDTGTPAVSYAAAGAAAVGAGAVLLLLPLRRRRSR